MANFQIKGDNNEPPADFVLSAPERGSIAEWPESFAADELGAQERYLSATEPGG